MDACAREQLVTDERGAIGGWAGGLRSGRHVRFIRISMAPSVAGLSDVSGLRCEVAMRGCSL